MKGIRQDIHHINETKNPTQSMLMLLLEGQGWSKDKIEEHVRSYLPPSQQKEQDILLAAVGDDAMMEDLTTGGTGLPGTPGTKPAVIGGTTPDSTPSVSPRADTSGSRRRRLSNTSKSRTSGDKDADAVSGPLGALNRLQLVRVAGQLGHEVTDDMEKASIIAAISHAPSSDCGCFVVVNRIEFPDTTSQFCAVDARVSKIPLKGTSGLYGVLTWSISMPKWTGPALKRGEAVPDTAMGRDVYDVPLSHCFLTREAAEVKAAQLNPPAKRNNPQDGNGAGAHTLTGNAPGSSGAPLLIGPAFDLAVANKAAKEAVAWSRAPAQEAADPLDDKEQEDARTRSNGSPKSHGTADTVDETEREMVEALDRDHSDDDDSDIL